MGVRTPFVIMAMLLLGGAAARAGEIYRATGAHGEASFSDFALPDAVPVAVEVHDPSPVEADAARERAAQTLALADELEAARLEREQAHAERRAEARAAAERVPDYVPYPEPEHRLVGPWDYYGYPRSAPHHPGGGGPPHEHGGHGHHDDGEPTEPEPESPPPRSRPLTRRAPAGD